MKQIMLFILLLVSTLSVGAQQPPTDIPLIEISPQYEISALMNSPVYLKPGVPSGYQQFGSAVAIDGNTAIVGAPGDDNSGAAYVFFRQGNTWSQQAKLTPNVLDVGDSFGYSVAISGNTAVIGANYESSASPTNPNSNDSSWIGAAYVFTRTGTTWTQQAYLKASNLGNGDEFGSSVAISADENTIVVGAPHESGNGTDPADDSAGTSGAVYVFVKNGNAWEEQAYLKASNVDQGDYFGNAVDIDGDTIVVGAIREASNGSDQADNSELDAGAVYVFVRNGTTWTQQAYLKSDAPAFSDNFGTSVAIDGDAILVGAPGEDSGAIDSGAVYNFTREGSTWSRQQRLKSSNSETSDAFGHSVDLQDNRLVVGALREDGDGTGPNNNDRLNSGAAYTFRWNGSVWSEQDYLKGNVVDGVDQFGWSVAIDGEVVIVGGPSEDGNGSSPQDDSIEASGAAYVYMTDTGEASGFSSTPPHPSTLVTTGPSGAPTTTTLLIDNITTGFLLDVNLVSITPGFSIVSGLPITGLVYGGESAVVTIQCDSPGSIEGGEMVLGTNEVGSPTYSYIVVCGEGTSVIPDLPDAQRIYPANQQEINTTADYHPRFEWSHVQGVLWYHVFVSSSDYTQIFVNNWYEASDVCNAGVCTTPGDIWLFGNGEYFWWMGYWNQSIGPNYVYLYDQSRFTLDLPMPQPLTGVTPQGEISQGSVTLNWTAGDESLWYNIWVGPADYTATSYTDWLSDKAVCTGETCSVDIGVLTVNDYEFWVRSWNPWGINEWQKLTDFTVTP